MIVSRPTKNGNFNVNEMIDSNWNKVFGKFYTPPTKGIYDKCKNKFMNLGLVRQQSNPIFHYVSVNFGLNLKLWSTWY